jgi:hypothetical protein
MALILGARAQTNQNESRISKKFKQLLSSVNAGFTPPEGFVEVPPLNNDKTAYQYALELPKGEFEVRFQVNATRRDWKNYERGRSDPERVNPDSLYNKIAEAQVNSMAGEGRRFNRPIPPHILQYYNADIGKSYFFNLTDSELTKHYQYALLVIIQKNHLGTISVICFGNERGPEFFKKINMLRNCLKFNPS